MLVRVTPDVRGDTHEKISTGQADSKFGFAIGRGARGDRARAGAIAGLALQGVHAHIGSQLLDLEPFRRACAELAALARARRASPCSTSAAGSGVRYTAGPARRRRAIEDVPRRDRRRQLRHESAPARGC